MQIRVSVLIACLVVVQLGGSMALADEIFVAFWNVENLFDTQDDASVELDEEFTPGAPKKWTQERLQIKLDNLSRVIRAMNRGQGPEVLGLCEVENRAVVDLLLAKLKALGRDYQVIHQDSRSGRGIDCAMVYDAKLLKPNASPRFHSIHGIDSRDVVESSFLAGQHTFTVMVNHWPSQFNPEDHREKAAAVVRARVDELLKVDPSRDIVLIGDFNELPDAPAISKTLRTSGDPAALPPGVLFNSTWPLHANKTAGTYVYRNRWEVLDQVILSPGMLDGRGINWVSGSTQTVAEKYQFFVSRNKEQIPRPSRSYTGNSFHQDGYSDHLPITCRLRY